MGRYHSGPSVATHPIRLWYIADPGCRAICALRCKQRWSRSYLGRQKEGAMVTITKEAEGYLEALADELTI